MTFFTSLIRKAMGVRVVPEDIVTKEPLEQKAYAKSLGRIPVTGDCSRISFSGKDAGLPFKTENESLWNFFEPELRRRLDELEKDESFAARVFHLWTGTTPESLRKTG